eukprot:TRINITY_DN24887_c0_g1_i1.p1 TRINITY_DN24887_c0_g1~~TRINITY_DN24887_c0_g1_i1.p1  ORF type:complete len:367 (-),score=40.18 TRINITY_DN24887_c0_g1_i1:160-1260(-)
MDGTNATNCQNDIVQATIIGMPADVDTTEPIDPSKDALKPLKQGFYKESDALATLPHSVRALLKDHPFLSKLGSVLAVSTFTDEYELASAKHEIGRCVMCALCLPLESFPLMCICYPLVWPAQVCSCIYVCMCRCTEYGTAKRNAESSYFVLFEKFFVHICTKPGEDSKPPRLKIMRLYMLESLDSVSHVEMVLDDESCVACGVRDALIPNLPGLMLNGKSIDADKYSERSHDTYLQREAWREIESSTLKIAVPNSPELCEAIQEQMSRQAQAQPLVDAPAVQVMGEGFAKGEVVAEPTVVAVPAVQVMDAPSQPVVQAEIVMDSSGQQDRVNPLAQIKELKDLLDSGAITQEEFETKKTELLAKV